jgi:hypothetical protein
MSCPSAAAPAQPCVRIVALDTCQITLQYKVQMDNTFDRVEHPRTIEPAGTRTTNSRTYSRLRIFEQRHESEVHV